MKRTSPPSNVKILEFWCSEEGKEILEKHSIKPYGIHTLTIDAGEECWCCDAFCCEGYYEGWRADHKKGKWSGDTRERCHIIAKSLGGSYECDNMFLMCWQCHRRAPNTNDPKIFFEWVVKENARAIQHRKDFSRGMAEIAKELFTISIDSESDKFKKVCEDISKFNSEFHGEAFAKFCRDKITTHGFGGRFHPDILNSELGLYKQYCVKNKSMLFPNL